VCTVLALTAAAPWLARGAQAQAQSAAVAVPPEVAADLPGARLQGSGRLTFFGLRVYDIRLWLGEAPGGRDPALLPLALELEYARKLSGRQIAERSLAEMKGIGEFDAAQGERWLTAMLELFPDVSAGDRITGVQRPGDTARFHVNGRYRGEVRDPAFTRLFFGIWLSPRTSEPNLRDALLGDARPAT
jgi:hypothetical protein